MEPTLQLARYAARVGYEDLPPAVIHAAKRCLLDHLGVALGAARHPSVDILLDVVEEMGGNPQASVVGRGRVVAAGQAALLNAHMAHVLDYDDTHLETIVHPTSPIAPVALALAEWRRLSGRRWLSAFVAGYEVATRVALAISPSHYQWGWHPTATLGTLGAAAAAGNLLGLSEGAMAHALGAAATLASGFREMFGTMCKPLHPGKAAMHGLLAAQLAARGFTSSPRALEAECGLWALFGEGARPEAALEGLGSEYQILRNAFKPYACGVVVHPVIDGALALRGIAPLESVAAVEVRAHPLVLALTGKKHPRTGLEGKFSVYHCVAASLTTGACGPAQFADALVQAPSLVALRERVRVEVDESLREDEAVVGVVLADGSRHTHHVAHATGSAPNPMSDDRLKEKYRSLARTTLPAEAVERLAGLAWSLDKVEDVGEVARLASGPKEV